MYFYCINNKNRIDLQDMLNKFSEKQKNQWFCGTSIIAHTPKKFRLTIFVRYYTVCFAKHTGMITMT